MLCGRLMPQLPSGPGCEPVRRSRNDTTYASTNQGADNGVPRIVHTGVYPRVGNRSREEPQPGSDNGELSGNSGRKRKTRGTVAGRE